MQACCIIEELCAIAIVDASREDLIANLYNELKIFFLLLFKSVCTSGKRVSYTKHLTTCTIAITVSVDEKGFIYLCVYC